jgi:hypothetical protein
MSHPHQEDASMETHTVSSLDQDSASRNLEDFRYSPLHDYTRIIRTMLANGKTIQQVQGYLRKQNVRVTQREIRESM